jgi:hypothetical protein
LQTMLHALETSLQDMPLPTGEGDSDEKDASL